MVPLAEEGIEPSRLRRSKRGVLNFVRQEQSAA